MGVCWAEDEKLQVAIRRYNPDKVRSKCQRRNALESENGLLSRSQLQAYKRLLIAEQDGKCYICDKAITIGTMEVDHKTPVTRGGTDDRENLGGACLLCNRDKHNKTEEEYRAWLKATKHLYR
jgi:5-methylcytosine-specific restriction endonuclease McrA